MAPRGSRRRAARPVRGAATFARGPRRRAGGHPARGAERHVGHDVTAVRAQQRLVGVDLVVCLVQQRQVQPDAQQQQCNRGQGEIEHQHQHLREARDVDEAQAHVHRQHRDREPDEDGPHDAQMLMPFTRRPGEPQCDTDQSAGGRGRQRHRHTADARLYQQALQRPLADDAGAELRSEPGQRRRRRERQRTERPDGEPFQGFSRRRPQHPDEHGGQQHQDDPAERNQDAHPHHARADDRRTQSDLVGPSEHRTRQQHPSHREPDGQRDGEHQGADREVAEGIRLAQVQDEQHRQSQGGDGDQRRGQTEQGEGDQRRDEHQQPDPERRARALR